VNEEKQDCFAAFVGIDWSDQEHTGCLQAVDSQEMEQFKLEQKPEQIYQWVNQLHYRFGGQKIAIALEQSRGALICALMAFDFLTLYPINTKTISNYRDALRSSGAKDDLSDAALLLHFLQTHWKQLRVWQADDEITRKLRWLVENRRKWVDNSTSLSQQMEQQLKLYYPQSLDWFSDLKSILACDFLQRWPSLQQIKKVKAEQLRKFFWKHNCRKNQLIEKRITEIHNAVPLTKDVATISASRLIVCCLIEAMRVALRSIEQFDKEIAQTFLNHPDRLLYKSLPGAGPVLQPRLAVALGTDRKRFQMAVELQQFSGTAPVTVKSGKSCWVHWRWACPKFMRQSFVEFAACSLVKSTWATQTYDRLRDEGKGHNAALRVVAFKWQRILFRMWKDQQPYDEQRYLNHLKRRHISGKIALKKIQATQSGLAGAAQIIESLKEQMKPVWKK
jgi:transposase